jgi:phosphopantothenoylcysteine decarboxylase / phosphopantothenate---cysteine ligase
MKIVITSGGTREPVDPVRFIGNYSTGKMGAALAQAFKGHDVTVIAGNSEVEYDAKVIKVETADEMLRAAEECLPCDIFIGAAAVADKRPKYFFKEKVKKYKLKKIILVNNPDILATIATHKKRPQLVIGFAAESENHVKNARRKLTKKSCDLIVLNDIKALGSDENEVWIIGKDFEQKIPKASKQDIAKEILKIAGQKMASK